MNGKAVKTDNVMRACLRNALAGSADDAEVLARFLAVLRARKWIRKGGSFIPSFCGAPIMKTCLYVILFLVACGTAAAAEGVFQINQTCAKVGCFAGDSAGFPVTITQAGSYRLTGNLDLTSAADPAIAEGITIGTAASFDSLGNVTLDLGGFSIKGAITCTGLPVTNCSTAAAPDGWGVRSYWSGATIRDGFVIGMSQGVICDRGCLIEDIHASSNAADGIHTSNALSVIDRCFAARNGRYGFWSSGNIRNSVAHENKIHGIFVQNGSAQGNSAMLNGGHGMVLGPTSA